MRIVGAPLSKKSVVTMDSRPSKALAENRDVGKKKGREDSKRLIPLTQRVTRDKHGIWEWIVAPSISGSYAGRGASINQWIKEKPKVPEPPHQEKPPALTEDNARIFWNK